MLTFWVLVREIHDSLRETNGLLFLRPIRQRENVGHGQTEAGEQRVEVKRFVPLVDTETPRYNGESLTSATSF
jgi:hypothetical protein